MSAKALLAFCAVAILGQPAFCACACGLTNSLGPASWGYGNRGTGLGSCSSAGVASSGGSLPVASASPVAPVGVSLLSENAYEGELCSGGNLPFLGTVGIEGVLPTSGVGSVSYGCGNGAFGITNESPINTGIIGGAWSKPAFCACASGLANSLGPASWGYGNRGTGLGSCSSAGVASSGGCLPVASASPVAPVDDCLLSENANESELCTSDNLPCQETVGIEEVLPTAGAGSVSYGCGNDAVGITSESPINTGIIGGAWGKSGSCTCAGLGGRAGTGYGLAGSNGASLGSCGGIRSTGSYGGYGAGLGSCGCGGVRSTGGYGGYGAGLGSSGIGAGLGSRGCGGVASTGGGLPVVSASPIAPVGISVQSENAYEGSLCASGNLPFLSAVGIEGVLPTAGEGAVSYGCGNGAVDITSEGPIGTGILGAGSFPPTQTRIAGNGLGGIGNGLGVRGCGYSC